VSVTTYAFRCLNATRPRAWMSTLPCQTPYPSRGALCWRVLYDREAWEKRWSEALREHGDRLADRPPNSHLRAAAGNLRPGHALDAGCGHGADTLWLAERDWQVTAVDFSATALAYARSAAEAAEVAERIDWVEGDLATWTPQAGHYDLVACLYVHVAGSVEEMVRRMAAGVAPGGTLFLVGHRPVDPATGAATAAAGQVQVAVDTAVAALDPGRWDVVLAEDRPRATAGTGVDAVICARRVSGPVRS
jgi:SAM-dependent methyltransferase